MKSVFVMYAAVKINHIKLERYSFDPEFDTNNAQMMLHCQMIDYWGLFKEKTNSQGWKIQF